MTGENVDVIENVETEDKIQLTSDVPTTDDLQNASDSFVSSVSSENVSRKEQLLDKQDVSVDEDKETVTTDIKEEGHDEAPEEKKGIVQIGDIATNKTVSEEKLGESREEDSVELGQETPILQKTRRTHSPLTPKPTDVVTLPPDKADEILGTIICYFTHTGSCEVKSHDIIYFCNASVNFALGLTIFIENSTISF